MWPHATETPGEDGFPGYQHKGFLLPMPPARIQSPLGYPPIDSTETPWHERGVAREKRGPHVADHESGRVALE